MLIGAAARRTGLSVKAIRFYEAVGLIPAPARAGRYRRYDEAAIERLLLVRDAKALGLSIAQIKRLLAQSGGTLDWQQIAVFLQTQKTHIHNQIQLLQGQLQQIDACLVAMESCDQAADTAEPHS
jgi:DNA-binding transcriptional MerR regulator